MIRVASILLLLTTSAFAAGPFVGNEERIGTLRTPTDLTLVRSADATLLAWSEGSQVRARVSDRTITLGTGIDVRAATDGRDFQIIWFDQNRIAGALWSNPSDVRTLVNFNTFNVSETRRPPVLVWNGSAFEIFFNDEPAPRPEVSPSLRTDTPRRTLRPSPRPMKKAFSFGDHRPGSTAFACAAMARPPASSKYRSAAR